LTRPGDKQSGNFALPATKQFAQPSVL